MRYFLLLFFVILNQISFSQDKTNLGFKSGVTFSNWDPYKILEHDPGPDSNFVNFSRVGFNAAIFLEYEYDSGFGILGSIGYNQKGQRAFIHLRSDSILFDYWLQFKNYSIMKSSLMMKYSLKRFVPNLYVVGGLSGEIIFWGSAKENEIRPIVTNLLMGINFGIGYEIKKFLPNTMIAEILLTHDLNSHFEDDYEKTKFITLELKLGYKFQIF